MQIPVLGGDLKGWGEIRGLPIVSIFFFGGGGVPRCRKCEGVVEKHGPFAGTSS
jgi:hypothetical protein